LYFRNNYVIKINILPKRSLPVARQTAQKILNLLKEAGAVSAHFLAEQLGLSDVGARAQLARLASKGLVTYVDLPASRGRPKRAWALSEAAQREFPDRHADLALEFLRGVQVAFGKFGLDGVIESRERELLDRYEAQMTGARGSRERLESLASLRSLDGYMAAVSETNDGQVRLVENHCPIQSAARQCPRLCASELDLLRRVLGGGVKVERIEHVLAGSRRCAFQITSLDSNAD
jgi:predicted ArsR family transcriptional regulator